MIKGLVSLLTPCYNSGKFVHRLLDSVLSQDYPSIEMVMVDDGSTDDTKQKIEAYIPKFEQRGYTLRYVYKENGGTASAINYGLHLLNGEFIAWPDSDDYYTFKDSISSFVSTLDCSEDKVGMVRSPLPIMELNKDGVVTKKEISTPPIGNPFKSIVSGSGFLMVNITYMIKAKALDVSIPNRKIYTGYNSQNIQMFEPITYCYDTVDTKPNLVTYVVRLDSDSHKSRSCEQLVERNRQWLDIHIHTLDRMLYLKSEEREHYKKMCANHQLKDMLNTSFHFANAKEAAKVMEEMKSWGIEIKTSDFIKLRFLQVFGATVFLSMQKLKRSINH